MSWREHWAEVHSQVESGDAIGGCRDNDTRTYRLFVYKGHRMQLREVLDTAIQKHQPWPNLEDD